jgi:hypothetical protein
VLLRLVTASKQVKVALEPDSYRDPQTDGKTLGCETFPEPAGYQKSQRLAAVKHDSFLPSEANSCCRSCRLQVKITPAATDDCTRLDDERSWNFPFFRCGDLSMRCTCPKVEISCCQFSWRSNFSSGDQDVSATSEIVYREFFGRIKRGAGQGCRTCQMDGSPLRTLWSGSFGPVCEGEMDSRLALAECASRTKAAICSRN